MSLLWRFASRRLSNWWLVTSLQHQHLYMSSVHHVSHLNSSVFFFSFLPIWWVFTKFLSHDWHPKLKTIWECCGYLSLISLIIIIQCCSFIWNNAKELHYRKASPGCSIIYLTTMCSQYKIIPVHIFCSLLTGFTLENVLLHWNERHSVPIFELLVSQASVSVGVNYLSCVLMDVTCCFIFMFFPFSHHITIFAAQWFCGWCYILTARRSQVWALSFPQLKNMFM